MRDSILTENRASILTQKFNNEPRTFSIYEHRQKCELMLMATIVPFMDV